MTKTFTLGFNAALKSGSENPYDDNPYEEFSESFFEWEKGMRSAFGLQRLDE